jgi:hypothetical protein
VAISASRWRQNVYRLLDEVLRIVPVARRW